MKKLSILTIIIIYTGCISTKPSLSKLAEINPEQVTAKQDSLMKNIDNNPEILALLVKAHLNIANKHLNNEEFENAIIEYKAVLELDNKNIDAKYGISMSKGFQLYNQGSPDKLWDSIEQFGKAAAWKQDKWEPHYWIAKAYEKKDSNDHELIIESYEQALNSGLPDKLHEEVQTAIEKHIKAKEVFDNFWK